MLQIVTFASDILVLTRFCKNLFEEEIKMKTLCVFHFLTKCACFHFF